MGKTDFDKLLHRYMTGQATPQERTRIEAWLEVMKTDRGADELTKEQEDELFFKITSKNNHEEQNDEHKIFPSEPGGTSESITTRRVFLTPLIRIAASIVLILSVSAVLWFYFKTDVVQLNHPVEKRILADGSIIWMRDGGTLTYSEDLSAGTRNITFSGDALFEVAKNPARPFIIHASGVTATVLGTSFNLKTNSHGLELSVLTGMVNLSSTAGGRSIKINRHEHIVYVADSKTDAPVNLIPPSELVRLTEHTEYNMKFANRPMNEVFAQIKNKFEVSISVSEPQLNNCRITADFTDTSLEKTFDMLTAILDMQFKISGKTVVVSGQGCK